MGMATGEGEEVWRVWEACQLRKLNQARAYEWGILYSRKVVYTLLHNLCLCNT